MGSLVSKCAPFHCSKRQRLSSEPTLTTTLPLVPANNSLNNLDADKPRLSVECYPATVHGGMAGSSTNGKIVHISGNHMVVTDEHGQQLHSVLLKTHTYPMFHVKNICWSSFLNQFLILPAGGRYHFIFAVDLTAEGLDVFKIVLNFADTRQKASMTCCEDRLMVGDYGAGSNIEEYDMKNWTLTRTYQSPISCERKNEIIQLSLNTDGTRLGIIFRDDNLSASKDKRTGILMLPLPHINYWFELRDLCDPELKVLHRIDGVNGHITPLMLPRQQQYLLTVSSEDKNHPNSKLLLINSNTGTLEEEIPYATKHIWSTALINEQCLLIHHSDTLFFYDL